MGNHAVALAGKGRYQEAYDELMKSKLRTDSIYFNTRTEESVLNFEIDNLTVEKEEGQATIRQKNIWLWILAAVLILISASAVTADIVSRRRRDRERKRSDELERNAENWRKQSGRWKPRRRRWPALYLRKPSAQSI